MPSLPCRVTDVQQGSQGEMGGNVGDGVRAGKREVGGLAFTLCKDVQVHGQSKGDHHPSQRVALPRPPVHKKRSSLSLGRL